MTNLTIKIQNLETGEIIDREMNAAELKQWELDKSEAEAKAELESTKAAEKSALLEKLGITADEAALLLS
jgi:hypothetical protein